MSWEWWLFLSSLLIFSLVVTFRIAFVKGYKIGALMVTRKWQQTLDDWEEMENEHSEND